MPVDLGREAAREAARRELVKPPYQVDRPGLVERALDWVDGELQRLLERVTGSGTPSWLGVLVILAVVAVLGIVLYRRVGAPGRTARADRTLFAGGGPRTAAEHRAAAEDHATAGRWAEAVRERLRAVVRDLEDRGLLDPRPGRTADEVAAEAGQALPECAADLAGAARTFDDIWYGGRTATPEHDATLRALDGRLRRSRPVGAGGPR